MNSDFKVLLRSLKGAPASIMLALLAMQGGALTQKELIRLTGYSDKTVSAGLDLLISYDLVSNHGRWNGYTLGRGAHQLSLNLQLESQDVGNFPTSSLTTTTMYLEEKLVEIQEVAEAEEDLGNSPTFEILVSAGVGPKSKAMRRIVEMEIPIEDVQAHVNEMHRQREAGQHFSVGLLIRKLLDGDPPPEPPERPAWEDIVQR